MSKQTDLCLETGIERIFNDEGNDVFQQFTVNNIVASTGNINKLLMAVINVILIQFYF